MKIRGKFNAGGMKMPRITFNEKPGEIFDLFYSLWTISNYDFEKQRKLHHGIEENEYEKLIGHIIEEKKIEQKNVERYFYQELEPENLLLLSNVWKHQTIDEYLEYISNLNEFEIRKRIVRITKLIAEKVGTENFQEYENIAVDKESVLNYIKDKDISNGLKWEMFLIMDDTEKYIQEFVEFIQGYMETYKLLNNKRKEVLEDFNKQLKVNFDKKGIDFLNVTTNHIFNFEGHKEIFITSSATKILYIGYEEDMDYCYVVISPYLKDILEIEAGEDEIERNLELMRDICESTRFKIIKLLLGRDYYVMEIADELEQSKANISYHMNFLLKSKLVTIEKDAQKNYYCLNKKELRDCFEFIKKELGL